MQQGIAHHPVPTRGVRAAPVIARRRGGRQVRTAAVGEVIAVGEVGDAGCVGVSPVGGDAAVVVFEVWLALVGVGWEG